MVVVSMVLFEARYFLGLPKCFLIPEKVMTYLGIQCDSLRTRFFVPEERVQKYLPLLRDRMAKTTVSFSGLECAVPAGMWYTRFQYVAMKKSGISPDPPKSQKTRTLLPVTKDLLEEWSMWVYFLQLNTGSAWKTLQTVLIQAGISSDAPGRTFAGVVKRMDHPDKVVAGEFWGPIGFMRISK